MNFIAIIGIAQEKIELISTGFAKAIINVENEIDSEKQEDWGFNIEVFIKQDELKLPETEEAKEWSIDKQKAGREKTFNAICKETTKGVIMGIKGIFKPDKNGQLVVGAERVQCF